MSAAVDLDSTLEAEVLVVVDLAFDYLCFWFRASLSLRFRLSFFGDSHSLASVNPPIQQWWIQLKISIGPPVEPQTKHV